MLQELMDCHFWGDQGRSLFGDPGHVGKKCSEVWLSGLFLFCHFGLYLDLFLLFNLTTLGLPRETLEIPAILYQEIPNAQPTLAVNISLLLSVKSFQSPGEWNLATSQPNKQFVKHRLCGQWLIWEFPSIVGFFSPVPLLDPLRYELLYLLHSQHPFSRALEIPQHSFA